MILLLIIFAIVVICAIFYPNTEGEEDSYDEIFWIIYEEEKNRKK